MKYRTLINFLILQSPRGIGQSTNLVNLAKKIDANYICFNMSQKINLKQEFDINALTIDEEKKLFGSRKPILIDHFASLQLFNEIMYENKTLEEEIEKLKEERGRKEMKKKKETYNFDKAFPKSIEKESKKYGYIFKLCKDCELYQDREKEEQEAVEEAINKYKEVNNDHR